MFRRFRRPSSQAVAVLVLSGVLAMFGTSTAKAQVVAPASTPSDVRASFVSGNVSTCAGAGILSTPGNVIVQIGADGNASADDGFVSGTVTPRPGGGEEMSVTILDPDVVIDAVMVKGGAAYNLYTDPAVLPPTLPPPDQHYIAPVNAGGQVPLFSHWFVCYHTTTPLPTGTLAVTKSVQAPDGLPVTALPTSYSALVNCNDGNPLHQNVTVEFNVGGGRQTTPLLTGIPVDTVCTVVEQGGTAPSITYSPVGANTLGVVIGADVGVIVNIANDFSSVAVQRGSLQFVKVVVPPPPGVELPVSFTVEVACDDGTFASVEVPGTGGVAASEVSVRSVSFCAFAEDTASLPAGWTVSYSVSGGAPTADPQVVAVLDASAVVITVTNDASLVLPPTTVPETTTTLAATTTTVAGVTTTVSPPPSGDPPPATSSGGGGFAGDPTLPVTGGSQPLVWIAAALLVVAGGLALLAARRPPQRR